MIYCMETSKWKPIAEEQEVMKGVWMQVKGASEKLKEETKKLKMSIFERCFKKSVIGIIYKTSTISKFISHSDDLNIPF